MSPPQNTANVDRQAQLEAETKLEYLKQDLLDFSPDNPRFGGLMKGHTQEEIQKVSSKSHTSRQS